MTVHPIEAESYRILAGRADLSAFGPSAAAVVARVIHASADVEYAATMILDEAAVAAGIPGIPTVCYLSEAAADTDAGLTRSAAGMRIAAARHPEGAVVVVGCAPTALAEVVRLWGEGALRPALVVGLPVGFVGAVEAKAALRAQHALASISNVGEKGGSAVAAAAVNAMARLTGARP